MNRNFPLTTSIYICFTFLFTIVVYSQQSFKSIPPQIYKGFKINVLSVDNEGNKYAPSDLVGVEFSAYEGNDLIVIRFVVENIDSEERFKAMSFRLLDEYGNDCGDPTLSLISGRHGMKVGESSEFIIPFNVFKGIKFRTFQIEGLSFDLSKLDLPENEEISIETPVRISLLAYRWLKMKNHYPSSTKPWITEKYSDCNFMINYEKKNYRQNSAKAVGEIKEVKNDDVWPIRYISNADIKLPKGIFPFRFEITGRTRGSSTVYIYLRDNNDKIISNIISIPVALDNDVARELEAKLGPSEKMKVTQKER